MPQSTLGKVVKRSFPISFERHRFKIIRRPTNDWMFFTQFYGKNFSILETRMNTILESRLWSLVSSFFVLYLINHFPQWRKKFFGFLASEWPHSRPVHHVAHVTQYTIFSVECCDTHECHVFPSIWYPKINWTFR